jgi:hypothetical protein
MLETDFGSLCKAMIDCGTRYRRGDPGYDNIQDYCILQSYVHQASSAMDEARQMEMSAPMGDALAAGYELDEEERPLTTAEMHQVAREEFARARAAVDAGLRHAATLATSCLQLAL